MPYTIHNQAKVEMWQLPDFSVWSEKTHDKIVLMANTCVYFEAFGFFNN